MPEETSTRDTAQEWTRKALLFDFYAPLLTKKQCSIWDNYYQMDLSMVEIARQRNTTRQAVHALLKRTEESLELYEKKMGLIEHFVAGKDLLLQVDKRIQSLLTDTVTNRGNQEESLSGAVAEIRILIQKILDTY
ncbi:MAG: hypothetical protein FWG14_01020 [Peptococcaceae bacterium]|nr:hypothetical protein [Peptococcaceae bacterium]